MNDAIVQIKDIKQAFRAGFWLNETEILHGLSFGVKRNSIFGLLGANGAGKTTLIHILVGLKKAKAGQIFIDGQEAGTREARSLIGYLPERPYFHDHLTGEGILYYMGTLSGMSRAEIDRRIPEVLERVGMNHARKLELRKYSKGMLQRIGIAQAILHDPPVLVLDEPSSGLDPVGRTEMRELILSLAKAGKTIFFSSHIIPDVEAICDEIALIEKGHLKGCGSISTFFHDQMVPWEILVKGAKEEELKLAVSKVTEKFKVEARLDGHQILLDAKKNESKETDEVIKNIIELGAHIRSAHPRRHSLEELFKGAYK